jgi:rubrerythrin
MTQAADIVDFAMRMEQEAGDFYARFAQEVRRESVRVLLLYLADWERGHFRYLQAHRNALREKGRWGESVSPPLDAKEGKNILEKARGGEGIELPIQECATDLGVLRIALSMEKDFAAFYENAAAKMEDPEAGRILQELARWEQGHMDMILEELESLQKDFKASMGFEPF